MPNPMFYILFYETVDDYLERRLPYREAHLSLAEEAHLAGQLLLGGALADPAGGAVLVFQCDSPEKVEDFVAQDPYVKNGLIKSWTIRPWAVVIGPSVKLLNL